MLARWLMVRSNKPITSSCVVRGSSFSDIRRCLAGVSLHLVMNGASGGICLAISRASLFSVRFGSWKLRLPHANDSAATRQWRSPSSKLPCTHDLRLEIRLRALSATRCRQTVSERGVKWHVSPRRSHCLNDTTRLAKRNKITSQRRKAEVPHAASEPVEMRHAVSQSRVLNDVNGTRSILRVLSSRATSKRSRICDPTFGNGAYGIGAGTLAQTSPTGNTAGTGPTGGTSYYPSGPATPSRSAMNSQPEPENSELQTNPKHARRCRAGRYGLIQRTVSDIAALDKRNPGDGTRTVMTNTSGVSVNISES